MNIEQEYIKFSEFCLKQSGLENIKVKRDDKKIKLGEIVISPYLFFKSENIKNAFNDIKEYDAVFFCEYPILDVLTSFEKPRNSVPRYSSLLVSFNNQNLLEAYYNMTDVEFYQFCQEHKYRIKTLFSNILVKEKMTLYGVLYISKDKRKHHVNDIINFFANRENNS